MQSDHDNRIRPNNATSTRRRFRNREKFFDRGSIGEHFIWRNSGRYHGCFPHDHSLQGISGPCTASRAFKMNPTYRTRTEPGRNTARRPTFSGKCQNNSMVQTLNTSWRIPPVDTAIRLDIFQHGLNSQAAQFSARLRIQFAFDILSMRVDRMRAEKQLLRDGACRDPCSNQAKDFQFAIGE